MLSTLQIAAVIVAALAMLPAVAHALELPGKMRLEYDTYARVQRIYYPGFTIAGFAEPLAIIVTAALLIVTPHDSTDFWWTAAALLALGAMHAIYWSVTHPVNKVWTADEKLGRAGTGFFGVGAGVDTRSVPWTDLRDRWEYSHVVRACIASVGFVALVIAASGADP